MLSHQSATNNASRPIVAGVPISHPDRLIYPDLAISKLDIARYYEAIADWVLPHVVGRPLTLLHCPDGMAAPCRFLKHAKQWGPSAIRRVQIQEKTKIGEYLVADSIEAVVALVQMGIVEVQTEFDDGQYRAPEPHHLGSRSRPGDQLKAGRDGRSRCAIRSEGP